MKLSRSISLILMIASLAGCASGGSSASRTPSRDPEPRAATRTPPQPSMEASRQNTSTSPADTGVKDSPPAIGVLEPAPQPKPKAPPRRVEVEEPPQEPARTRPRSQPRTRQPERQASASSNGLDVLLGSSPKIRAQESDSATSIRGFSPLSREYGQEQGMKPRVLDAVQEMENFSVTDRDLRRFLREGGLRPPRR